jgi:hypothetical protein
MKMTDTKHEPRTIHALKSGFSVPFDSYSGRALYQNETVTLTAEQVAETFDRNGVSWLTMTDDDQLAKWGELRFANGPAPEDAVIGADDASLRYRLWERARKRAESFSDPFDRKVELAKVAEEFPDMAQASSQRTLQTYEGQ